MIKDIADVLVDLSKENPTDDQVRDLYSVWMDLSMEIRKRMKKLTEEARWRKKDSLLKEKSAKT